jgi:hypothetical protein
MTGEELMQLHEVRARLDNAATLGSQALLGEVPHPVALEGMVSLVESARLHLKAIGR